MPAFSWPDNDLALFDAFQNLDAIGSLHANAHVDAALYIAILHDSEKPPALEGERHRFPSCPVGVLFWL